jgi:hypothetical protein
VGRLVIDGDVRMILVKQLVFENANAAYQATIFPYKKRGTLVTTFRFVLT